jgi:hypothetical protein
VKGHDDANKSDANDDLLDWGTPQPIAPAEVIFTLNASVWERYLAKLGEIQPTSFVLNCGNSQKQTLKYL